MQILVDNQLQELIATDPRTGCDWVRDLIGNADGYDDVREMYTMDPATYAWWDYYTTVEQELQDRIHTLRAILSSADRDQLERALVNASDSDYEHTQANTRDVVDRFERVTH